MDMKISVIIPAFNEERYIERCLSSILKCEEGAFSEIIVVDNASTDRTAEVARAYKGARVVSESVKGTNSARQKGFRESTGDVVVFIDADTEVTPEWFACIRRKFENDPELVCLSGPLYYADVPIVKKVSVWMYWNILALPFYFVLGYMATGGNCAIRRVALEKLGGFNTDIRFYGDDTNTARRLHAVGRVVFTKKLWVYTSSRRLKGQGFLKTGFIYGANFLSEAFLHRPVTKGHKDIR